MTKLQASGEEDETFRSCDSQSQEYELMPPKSDSYTNLFDAGQDVPLGGSAHSLRNHIVAGQDSSKLAPTSLMPLPAKMLYPSRNALAASTLNAQHHGLPDGRHPLAPHSDSTCYLSKKNIVGSPTTTSRSSNMLASDEKYPVTNALVRDPFVYNKTIKQSPPSSISGLSRIVSLTGARTSPVGTHYQYGTSGSTSLHGQSTSNGASVSSYRPLLSKDSLTPNLSTVPANSIDSRTALLKSVMPVDAPGIDNIPGAIRRPMSFVKALEVSDQLTVPDQTLRLQRQQQQQQKRQSGLQKEIMVEEEEEEECEKQLYTSSYEIAV